MTRCCTRLHGLEQPVAGHVQVKLHAWFAGLDWANLARTKAAFIPALDSPTDTAYFAPKPARIPTPLCCCSKNLPWNCSGACVIGFAARRSFHSKGSLHLSTSGLVEALPGAHLNRYLPQGPQPALVCAHMSLFAQAGIHGRVKPAAPAHIEPTCLRPNP